MRRRWSTNAGWCLAFTVALALGCDSGSGGGSGSDGDSASNAGAGNLQGDVVIDGSSTVFPITESVADAFKESFPKVNVTVAVSGTGGGFKRFVKGETDVSNASRPIKPSELEQTVASDVPFIEVPVAYDGLTIVVNPENDWVDQLTVDQLKKIFLEDGAAKTWADVKEGWPADEIRIYSPGTDSGTFDYFREVVVGKSESAIRSDMSVSEDDNVLVTGVAGQKTAIGFFGAAYYFENEESLRAVPIVNSAGEAVLPSSETIKTGTYEPFSRPLFIYVKESALKRPEMKKFVQFYLDHAGESAKDVGYVALPDEVYARAQEHVKQRLVGTHFLTAEGEKREGALPEVYVEDNLVWKE